MIYNWRSSLLILVSINASGLLPIIITTVTQTYSLNCPQFETTKISSICAYYRSGRNWLDFLFSLVFSFAFWWHSNLSFLDNSVATRKYKEQVRWQVTDTSPNIKTDFNHIKQQFLKETWTMFSIPETLMNVQRILSIVLLLRSKHLPQQLN